MHGVHDTVVEGNPGAIAARAAGIEQTAAGIGGQVGGIQSLVTILGQLHLPSKR